MATPPRDAPLERSPGVDLGAFIRGEQQDRLATLFNPLIDVMPRSYDEASYLLEMHKAATPLVFSPTHLGDAGGHLQRQPAASRRIMEPFEFTGWLDPTERKMRALLLAGARGQVPDLEAETMLLAVYFNDNSVHVSGELTGPECTHLFERLGGAQMRGSQHLVVRAFARDPGLGRLCTVDVELWAYMGLPIRTAEERRMFFEMVDDDDTASEAAYTIMGPR